MKLCMQPLWKIGNSSLMCSIEVICLCHGSSDDASCRGFTVDYTTQEPDMWRSLFKLSKGNPFWFCPHYILLDITFTKTRIIAEIGYDRIGWQMWPNSCSLCMQYSLEKLVSDNDFTHILCCLRQVINVNNLCINTESIIQLLCLISWLH